MRNVQLSGSNFGFVEFRDVQTTATAMQFAGAQLLGRPLKIGRPTGYVPSPIPIQPLPVRVDAGSVSFRSHTTELIRVVIFVGSTRTAHKVGMQQLIPTQREPCTRRRCFTHRRQEAERSVGWKSVQRRSVQRNASPTLSSNAAGATKFTSEPRCQRATWGQRHVCLRGVGTIQCYFHVKSCALNVLCKNAS